MALTDLFKWRIPEGVQQPVVHVDIGNLASDIESTMSRTRRLVPGFPKKASIAGQLGWTATLLYVYKWELGPNHFEYEFTGYIGRSSGTTVLAGVNGEVIVNGIFTEDIFIDGGPNVIAGVYAMVPVQGGGSMYNGIQVMIQGSGFRVRSTGQCGLTTSHYFAINGYKGYSTV